MTNWPFYFNCIMPQDWMFDWRHNSSSRSVAARILAVNRHYLNKIVTAEVKKVEIEVAASLWCHWSTTTIDHLSEMVKSSVNGCLLQINLVYFWLDLVYLFVARRVGIPGCRIQSTLAFS